MKILKKRAALLSNLEVLTHFKSLHAENTLITSSVAAERARRDRQKQDFDTFGFGKDGRVDFKGKGREMNGGGGGDVDEDIELKTPDEEQREREMAIRGASEDTIFVTEQIVKYLSTPGLASTTRQSPRAVATLMRQLTDPSRAYGLTKAEVLGCVNIAPTKLVELFTIVEECEDRLTPEQMQDIIELVQASLSPEGATINGDGDDDGAYDGQGAAAEQMDALAEDDEEYMANWEGAAGQGGDEFYAESKWGNEPGVEDEGDGAIDE